MLRELGKNVNTNLSDSIDIKAANTDISAALGQIEPHKCDFSGAFLNSLRILEKGTAFLLEFSENYQFYLQTGRSIVSAK